MALEMTDSFYKVIGRSRLIICIIICYHSHILEGRALDENFWDFKEL